MARDRIIAALDIGSTKIVCFIARVDEKDGLEVIGIGHQVSKGMRSGVVTDIHAAQRSIVAAVHAAEQMANLTLERVYLGFCNSQLASRIVRVETEISEHGVTERDISEMISQGYAAAKQENEEIIHCIPTEYILDHTGGISDPIGMLGRELAADLHFIAAPANAIHNLAQTVAKCHLDIESYVVTPLAAGLSCLEEDERQLGGVLLDIGGGMTSIGIYAGGALVHTDAVPVGGGHITSDIAKGLSTSLASAERIKTIYGCAITSAFDQQETLRVPTLGDEEQEEHTIMRSELIGIIRPRVEEIFEMVRGKVEDSGFEPMCGRNAVLTGGGAQLTGIRDIAGKILNRQVRIATPKAVPGLAEATAGPGFANAIGMLEFALNPDIDRLRMAHNAPRIRRARAAGGGGGMWRWLKENF